MSLEENEVRDLLFSLLATRLTLLAPFTLRFEGSFGGSKAEENPVANRVTSWGRVSSNPGRRAAENASRAPGEFAFCW